VIGPFAHLRPGTELAPEVHIGNFVETKKARVGRGTKANHLTYLGDLRDRRRDQRRRRDDHLQLRRLWRSIARSSVSRVQIGSDTQLVRRSPSRDDAYIGAGTTVTRDVPQGHLVVSRVPQRGVRDG